MHGTDVKTEKKHLFYFRENNWLMLFREIKVMTRNTYMQAMAKGRALELWSKFNTVQWLLSLKTDRMQVARIPEKFLLS